jgi:energy-coupling factor transporter ATP-binding protein EcfA2
MWLKSVKLENIKCFENIELFFTHKQSVASNAKPHRWITLLGENGIGKSTVLQSIGLLLAGPDSAKELLPRPTGWVRNPSNFGKLTAHICKEQDDQSIYGGDQRTRENFSYSYFITGDKEIKVPLKGRKRQKEETYTEPVVIEESSAMLSRLRVNAFASGNKGWFAVGYGSFRRLTRTSQILIPRLDAPTRAGNFITQFDEDSALSSFERWIVYLDYRFVKDKTDKRSEKMREVGEKAITALLPGDVKIVEVTKDGLIQFLVKGQIVPTINLSDGYRSIIAFAGDLIWRLLQTFPDMDDPTQASGVVLIDELDIHLHPIWQRNIASWLRKTFPNMQFIVATHSPFIAIGAGDDALTLRFTTDADGTIKHEIIDNIANYDVDRVLRSSAFGLVSTYSESMAKKIHDYHQLMFRFPQLNDKEKKILDELKGVMKKINLTGEIPEPGSLSDRMNRFLEENLP